MSDDEKKSPHSELSSRNITGLLAHEEGRMEHLLFGRSNDELVRKMPCSIILVKSEPEARL